MGEMDNDLEFLESDESGEVDSIEEEQDLADLDDGDDEDQGDAEGSDDSSDEDELSDKADKEEDEDGKGKEKSEVKEELTDDDLAGPPSFKRPTIGAIKKNFPEFFKKHPEMAECILRERHFTEIHPTIEMAKQAAINSERYENISAKLVNGEAEALLDALGDNSEPLVANFLPSLYKKNPAKFREITAPIFQTALRNAAEAKKDDGTPWEDMQNAADYIAHFMFGKTVKNLPTVQVNPEVAKIQNERAQEKQQQAEQVFKSAISSVAGSVEGVIESLNKKALEPAKLADNRFKKVNNEVLDKVQELVSGDIAHSKYMAQLWASAKRDNYSNLSVGKIKNAMLSRVKQLLPKARAEVLKDYGISLKPVANRSNAPVRVIPGSRPAPKASKTIDRDTMRGKSDRELLDMD